MPTVLYADRRDAGRQLAPAVRAAGAPPGIVLGLARGGVPVAYEVAIALDRTLDALIVRKLGVPGQEELAMGAIASGGVRVPNHAILASLPDADVAIERAVAREQPELERRERLYRHGRPLPPVEGRGVVLVDDGLATGASMRAAVRSLRRRAARRIVVAVPIGAADVCAALEADADVDAVVCLSRPARLVAVGAWYADFRPTTDDEIRELLDAAGARRSAGPDAS